MTVVGTNVAHHKIPTLYEGIKKIWIETSKNFFSKYMNDIPNGFLRVSVKITDELKGMGAYFLLNVFLWNLKLLYYF